MLISQTFIKREKKKALQQTRKKVGKERTFKSYFWLASAKFIIPKKLKRKIQIQLPTTTASKQIRSKDGRWVCPKTWSKNLWFFLTECSFFWPPKKTKKTKKKKKNFQLNLLQFLILKLFSSFFVCEGK